MVIQTPTLYIAPPNSGAGFGTVFFCFFGIAALFVLLFFWWKYDTENKNNKKTSSNTQFPYE